jgi:hypothetical protein
MGLLLTASCSDDGGKTSGGSVGGSAGSASASAGTGGGVVPTGSGGATGGGGSSAGGASVGPLMGVGQQCMTFKTPPANAPRSLTPIYKNAPHDDSFSVGTRILTFRNNLIYVVEMDQLKSITLDGTVQALGPAPAGKPDVDGDYFVYTESSTTQDNTLDNWVAPFDKPDQKTQIASTRSGLDFVLGDGKIFWEAREPAGIWSAPLTGGAGAELVPNGQPTGMVVDGGYLYFTDFMSSMLERVPTAGGTREPLTQINYGGTMTAGFGALYWRGPTGRLSRYQMGGEEESVFGENGWETGNVKPVMGGAYFSAGSFTCDALYYLPLSSNKPELLLSGFDQLTRIVTVTDKSVYLQDMNAIYRIDR